MELHIFNGDCACDAWKRAGNTARSLVWRETYLEGAIPAADTPPEEFARIRANELHRMMPELSFEKLFAELQRMDRALAMLTSEDVAWLWFDACMFDQLQLARILFLLEDTPATLFLICDDVVWGDDPTLFARKQPEARRLDRDDIALFAAAWRAVAGGEQTVRAFPIARAGKDFPFLAQALTRYAEEFPGADGLGRSERQLLAIVGGGKSAEAEIFRAVAAYEPYPFMGDTMCRRLLDELVQKRRLVIASGADGDRFRLI